ncbi:superinfection immunity protein [Actinomadura verrucosospora]|uniref:Ethanolamine permease n=1 Tax=Actinomadura verrucosospora TaxID=46165 RepID=A0A7D3VR08_ACTVE|nr:superinfection immunity protein [Actinomadura verrucosospora]QKG20119.1 ethanolamine permease [Actinomadura verrucosospora]
MATEIPPDWYWGPILMAFIGLATLPTFIALVRGADEILLIMLVNALCCATVIGWPLALIMAIKWPRKYPRPLKTPTPLRHPPLPERRDLSKVVQGRVEAP